MHALPFEELGAQDVQLRFPAWRLEGDQVAILEPRAGVLEPERIIEEQLRLARNKGATLRFDEPVLEWRAAGDGVEVTTARGRYRAARLVVAAGAWTRTLADGVELPLTVERNIVHWFSPVAPTDAFDAAQFPIFIHEYAPGRVWYGFPDLGDGVKLALPPSGAKPPPPTRSSALFRRKRSGWCARLRGDTSPTPTVHCASPRCACTRTPPTNTSCSARIQRIRT